MVAGFKCVHDVTNWESIDTWEFLWPMRCHENWDNGGIWWYPDYGNVWSPKDSTIVHGRIARTQTKLLPYYRIVLSFQEHDCGAEYIHAGQSLWERALHSWCDVDVMSCLFQPCPQFRSYQGIEKQGRLKRFPLPSFSGSTGTGVVKWPFFCHFCVVLQVVTSKSKSAIFFS